MGEIQRDPDWSVFPRSSDWIFLSLRCFILRFCLSTYSLIPPPLSVSPFGPSFTSLRCYFNVQFSLNFNWVLSLNHVGVTLHHHVTTYHQKHQMIFSLYRLEEIYEHQTDAPHFNIPKTACMWKLFSFRHLLYINIRPDDVSRSPKSRCDNNGARTNSAFTFIITQT